MTAAALPPNPQPFYCEENAWHLARAAFAAGEPGPVEVVFVSNPRRTCAVWAQRAAVRADEPVIWDYHVVVHVAGEIRDPDCLVGHRLPAERWLRASFPPGIVVPVAYRPQFRRCPADTFLSRFASDRSHMRDETGAFRAPPPTWPPIVAPDGARNTLPQFLDFGPSPLPPWLELQTFRKALATTSAR
ncbi:hypothetical protein L6V77_09500 [Myxococcota bacterium]|nr:hypothetical protein [Myxococcota bacterium]